MFMNMGVPDGILIHGKHPHTDCILPLFQEFYLQCKIMNNPTYYIYTKHIGFHHTSYSYMYAQLKNA